MVRDRRHEAFEQTFGVVYVPLQRYLRRRCSPSEVDDVLNDALLTIWRRVDDIPRDAPLPWCYGVARRCLANHRRSTHRRLRLADRAADVDRSPRVDDWTDEHDVALQEALDRLGHADREILRLWAWEGLGPSDIATVVDATPNAISIRLSRLRTRLASELSRKESGAAGQIPKQRTPELKP
jgi:RNA polymerase sigma-70 factor (ECF subfamily)